jgi:hypothetical protein
MNMLFSREWLRHKIANDPDIDVDAGVPLAVLEDIGAFIPPEMVETRSDTATQTAFSRVVVQLRRREQLTPEALASAADVDIEEVQLIERDPHYQPRPRTIHQISNVFRINARAMMKLSGVTRSVDPRISNAAIRFAAKSDAAITKLSEEEKAALNDFVKALEDSVR